MKVASHPGVSLSCAFCMVSMMTMHFAYGTYPSILEGERCALEELILSHEPIVRLGAFLLVFLAMAAAEPLAPRRRLTTGKGRRWGRNLAIVALDTLLVRALAAIAPV